MQKGTEVLLPRYSVDLREIYWLTDNPDTVVEEATRLSFLPTYAELLDNLDTAIFVLLEDGVLPEEE